MNVLESLETKIEAYESARAEAGKALVSIYEGDLWMDHEGAEDFLDYCEKRFGFKKSRAYQIMDYGKLALAANGSVVLPREDQNRVLKHVKPSRIEQENGIGEWEKRAKAWDAISAQYGADLPPDELKEVLTQEQFIVPRAKSQQISKEQREERAQRVELRKLNNAMAVLAEASKPFSFWVKKFGKLQLPYAERAQKYFEK